MTAGNSAWQPHASIKITRINRLQSHGSAGSLDTALAENTCILVPAFAGSTPSRARAKGSAVPVKTELITIRNNEEDIAKELTMLPLVT